MRLADALVMLIMLIMQIRSFVCLSPTRTCRAMARLAQQRNSAGGREWPQRCWATRTMGVSDVSSPREELSRPREIYASGGAYSWRP